MTTEKPAAALSTTDGARCYIAHFFAREMGRHDFATYIATDLAADFACALAQHLAARQLGAQEPALWVSPEQLEAFLAGSSTLGARLPARLERAGLFTAPLYAASPEQGIDPGPVREFLRRRMAQWRSHLPSDPGAPGTVAISGDGEGGYNNDVRMYREGIALMDRVLALIDDQRDATPGVGNG